ncbi:uncharacterized protein DEA37_0006147 [Paragonimus westermani]|uniref:FHA domain-containing protein n=1 Tax=Paragonimus westermani TaxID=34504 RepID=A0A5J4N8V6_9TREM|nr:uncharacterized protein DEA37_0006147 [Paragonimus westermani]
MSSTSGLVTSQADPEPEPSSAAINEPVEQHVGKCSIANFYRPPAWASVCPKSAGYHLEVIKNGILLPECTVHLSGTGTLKTETELSFCLIGRQPQQFYAPYNDLHGQCSVLAHPSISRLHAVLQYGRPPSAVTKTSATQVDSPGWYIQDLDSTHGTYINKRRLPPGRFVRIHVGYVIRFGGSTRLLLLHGPDDDVEKESSHSWTELKQAHLARQLAAEDVRSTTNSSSSNVDLGCDWGLSAEDADMNTPSFLAALNGAACLSHENLYQDDPKLALKAYFEREGIEPAPEYEFVEAAFGKQHCKIE